MWAIYGRHFPITAICANLRFYWRCSHIYITTTQCKCNIYIYIYIYIATCTVYTNTTTTNHNHRKERKLQCVHAHMCLCTPVNGHISIEKHHQCRLQVMTTTSASYVFALVKKNTTSSSCRGSKPSGELVRAGCSNQMQVAQGQVLIRVSDLVQAAIGCCMMIGVPMNGLEPTPSCLWINCAKPWATSYVLIGDNRW